jgi:hypothetical protein
MSTAPVTTTGFDWKNLIPAIELAGNVALSVLIPGGAAVAPLLASLEGAVNPLLQSIGTKPTPSTEIMTVYATIIGVLTTLKQTPGLPAATLATIDGYIISAQNGTAAYMQAQSGFNPALYTPVAPIA